MKPKKNEEIRMLRVLYTDQERLELGKKLAECHNSLEQVNADFDRVKADFKAKTSAHEANIVDLANKVSSGYRIEGVKCEWVMDNPVPGKKTLFRLDQTTRNEVETLAMTEADKQLEITLEHPPAGIAGDGTVAVEADKEKSD